MLRDPDQLPPNASDSDASLPAGLQADLSALYPTPRVPAVVNARVLNDAAATYARQARHRRRLRWVGAGAAAAAAVVIVALILPHRAGVVGPQPRYSLRGDLDGNGRVDILDAFSLARELRDAGGKPLRGDRLRDVNGDGAIDQKDVDLLARMAVQVEGAQ
jgi:Dockerin type I domain